ncbi:MAG: sigma-70 family RNA polymerase sigma factor [Wenzhouxiangellaceae bacterium]|nr:sigma-70 family RNA polymerase sigma factor [Wenzhouxiangellaceae bacterium]
MKADPSFPEAGSRSDADRLRAVVAGGEAAFESLYREQAPLLYPLLWRLAAGDRGLAEDWLQETFVRAWKGLDQLREPAALGGWMKRTALNVALADRRRKRLATVDAAPEATAPEPPWPCADRDLESAIAALPDRARQVLVMFHLADFTHAQIAEAMGIEVGTSKAQLSRARKLLKEMLS